LTREPTDTFHIAFNTKSMPGRVLVTKITIQEVIGAGLDDVFRLDLCDHPLYPRLQKYVEQNPARQID
jgi:hypothetical protein